MNYEKYETTLENCLKANFITVIEYKRQLRHIEDKNDRALEQFLDQLADRTKQIRARQRRNATDELTNIEGINFN